jgi:hypothetical protein
MSDASDDPSHDLDPPDREDPRLRRWAVSGLIDLDEINADRKRLASQEERGEWVDAITDLLPPHAMSTGGLAYKWTTPLGSWRLEINTGWGGPWVIVKALGGEWKLADHRVPYVESFLRLVGAI